MSSPFPRCFCPPPRGQAFEVQPSWPSPIHPLGVEEGSVSFKRVTLPLPIQRPHLVEEIYLHTYILNGNSNSGAGPWPCPLCAAAAAGCTQDNVVPSSQTNQAAQTTSAVTAGLGLVHKHCSHSVTGCPSPLFLGRVSSSACPQTKSHPLSWVGMPGAPGNVAAVSLTAGLCSQDGSQKLIAPSTLYSLLSPGSRRGLVTEALPCSPEQPAFGLHKHTHFPYRAFAGLSLLFLTILPTDLSLQQTSPVPQLRPGLLCKCHFL